MGANHEILRSFLESNQLKNVFCFLAPKIVLTSVIGDLQHFNEVWSFLF